MKIVLLACMLALPGLAFATYQNPTKESVQILSDGSAQVTFRFTGDAGEPPLDVVMRPAQGATLADIRRWVGLQLSTLNNKRSVERVLNGITGPLAPLPQLAPPAPPAPTALQVCQQKYARYREFAGSGLAGAVATAVAALKADIESTCAGELLP